MDSDKKGETERRQINLDRPFKEILEKRNTELKMAKKADNDESLKREPLNQEFGRVKNINGDTDFVDDYMDSESAPVPKDQSPIMDLMPKINDGEYKRIKNTKLFQKFNQNILHKSQSASSLNKNAEPVPRSPNNNDATKENSTKTPNIKAQSPHIESTNEIKKSAGKRKEEVSIKNAEEEKKEQFYTPSKVDTLSVMQNITKEKSETKTAQSPNDGKDFIVQQYEKLLYETQQRLVKVTEDNLALEKAMEKNNDMVSKLIERIYII